MPRLLTACLALILSLAAFSAQAQGFSTPARAAYVYDQTTGTVLFEKDADRPLPPASMSKLMTIYMTFEAIAQGRLTVDDTFPVSQHAMDYGGSSMFLRSGERVRVEDLIRGVIVLSGNDAATVLAEGLSPDGTEAGFARLMTDRAHQLGMVNSTFQNANGWPAAGHMMSVRDLGILAEHLIEDFPTFYPIFAEQEFHFDGRVPSNSQNRNPILGLGIGADGLKTGHTTEAGYGLVGSAKQGDRRIIFVVTGLSSMDERRSESERIVNWAFRQFAQREVVKAGSQLADAQVWMGAAPSVGLVSTEAVNLLVPALNPQGVSAEIVYTGPIAAPITEGQQLAELVVTREGLPEARYPLVAAAAVAQGGFSVRLKTAFDVVMGMVAPAVGAEPTADAPSGS